MNPRTRVKGSWVLLVVSIVAGVYCTIAISRDAFERVLMAISWFAITITALDVLATTDTRAKQEEEVSGTSDP